MQINQNLYFEIIKSILLSTIQYRDDGLAKVKGLSETKKVKKRVIQTFKYCGLKITMKANLYIVKP